MGYMNIKGDTALVGLPKEGPIYNTEWAPNGSVFAVVYGFMPAKATMFDLKGEPVFDFGTGPRNCVMFNPQSTLLMIGGFGNLRGKIEMWDVEKKSMVSTFDAPDSTSTSWCPDGQRSLTTTTAPRLELATVTRCGTTRDPSSTRKPLPQVTSSGKLIGSLEPQLPRSQSRSRWLQASLQANQRQQSKHIDLLALEEPSPLSNFTTTSRRRKT